MIAFTMRFSCSALAWRLPVILRIAFDGFCKHGGGLLVLPLLHQLDPFFCGKFDANQIPISSWQLGHFFFSSVVAVFTSDDGLPVSDALFLATVSVPFDCEEKSTIQSQFKSDIFL